MENIDENHELILKGSVSYSNEKSWEYSSVPEYILKCLEKQGLKSPIRAGITDGSNGDYVLYKDMEGLSLRVGSFLWKRGFRKGDTLIYATDEVCRLHFFLLGVWRANGIIRAFYPEILGEALISGLEESNSKWVLCDSTNAVGIMSSCQKAKMDVNLIVFGECPSDKCISVTSILEDDGDKCPRLDLIGEDIGAIMPTSGTTGKCKGVVLTHERLLTNMVSVEDSFEVSGRRGKPVLHLGKATHVSALLNFQFIAEGRNLIRLRTKNYTPPAILRAITTYQPSEITVNGLLLQSVLLSTTDQNLDSLKLVNLIGTAITPSMISIIKRIPSSPKICVLYGSTETMSLCYGDMSEMSESKIRAGVTGKLLPDVSMAVRDSYGSILGPGKTGELWFSSSHSSSGYFKKEEETKRSFKNGWIHTGDLGYYDKDGYVYLVGRSKEVFKYLGNHISPSEIEEVLLNHPFVAEACVVGVTSPDGLGQIPKAYVVLANPEVPGDPQEIIRFANARLASYMHLLGGLEIVTEFKRSPGGKIQRYHLQETNKSNNI